MLKASRYIHIYTYCSFQLVAKRIPCATRWCALADFTDCEVLKCCSKTNMNETILLPAHTVCSCCFIKSHPVEHIQLKNLFISLNILTAAQFIDICLLDDFPGIYSGLLLLGFIFSSAGKQMQHWFIPVFKSCGSCVTGLWGWFNSAESCLLEAI